MDEPYGNVVGWGKYIPERVITNADLERTLDTSNEWIVARTGIRERHIVSDDETTSTISVRAARQALERAQLSARDLDLIIVATSSPDYLTPPVSSQIQDQLGARGIGAFTLVAGCTGFVYGLATAQQFIRSGACRNVMVIGAEILSRFVDWKDRATCVLFGDAAGAVVLAATDQPTGLVAFDLGSDGSGSEDLIVPAGGAAQPPSEQTIREGLHYVRMNGQAVFRFAIRTIVRSLKTTMERASLTVSDIDLFIPHQANVRIIRSAARALGLPNEKIFINIDRYGNTSAASVPVALCEALESGRAGPGDMLALVAFGAGLTWASAILQIGPRASEIDASPGRRRIADPLVQLTPPLPPAEGLLTDRPA